jgi:phage replication O-like protein O
VENYTKIENEILEELTRINLSGSALACALVLLRKTNGFNKTQDGISLSQFVKLINRTKPTVCKALKELQLVNISLLVKKGKSGKQYSVYAFNKNIAEWKLVKKPLLVKKWKSTSKEMETQLVKKSLHTKETNTKETIQKKVPKGTRSKTPRPDISELIDFLTETVGGQLDGTAQSNRQYCYNLIRRFKKAYPDLDPVAQIKLLITVAQDDPFHSKNLTSFQYLFYNYVKIIKQKSSQMNSVVEII